MSVDCAKIVFMLLNVIMHIRIITKKSHRKSQEKNGWFGQLILILKQKIYLSFLLQCLNSISELNSLILVGL